ncbi:MAG: alanine--glyoxylate aminotransferase family protein [Caldilineaceae bacterium]|nr:alanine--glyoxylate aminotransferase family protein [Caldilineaceae bacterium]
MRQTKLPLLSNAPQGGTKQLDVPPRLLLGAGPSNVHARVLQALSTQVIGHLDPVFVDLMGEIQQLLRYLCQTKNAVTLPLSGTGSAAMEAAIANTIEPGDRLLVGVNGYFGARICEIASRYDAEVRRLEKPWGKVFDLNEIREGLERHRPAVLALVHGETSTGALQPLSGIGELCREHNTLLLVDSVTSLGSVPLYVDAWGIDVCYSASQKCLSAAPGVAPITLSQRAIQKRNNRSMRVRSWYLDTVLLEQYWGEEHRYHHTAPINLNYALRESMRMVVEEGLSECWQRHRNNAELLWIGLSDLDLDCYVEADYRLPSLTTIRVPQGINDRAVARYLLTHYNIEIGLGLGELAGKIWRVGLMGFNSRAENVTLLLTAFEEALQNAR